MPPDKKTQQENTNGILCFFFDRMGADGKRMESSRYWLPCSISNYTIGALIYCGLSNHSMCALRGNARTEKVRAFCVAALHPGDVPLRALARSTPTASAAVFREENILHIFFVPN